LRKCFEKAAHLEALPATGANGQQLIAGNQSLFDGDVRTVPNNATTARSVGAK
jgi:hypothetical protein